MHISLVPVEAETAVCKRLLICVLITIANESIAIAYVIDTADYSHTLTYIP